MFQNPQSFFSPWKILLWGLATASLLRGEEVHMQWQATGAAEKTGYYVPQRTALSTTPPEGLKKTPQGLIRPTYGKLTFGEAGHTQTVLLIIDESGDGNGRLYLDKNGNGDLLDDPPLAWEQKKYNHGERPQVVWSGQGTVDVPYGSVTRTLGLRFYHFDKADARGALLGQTLFYYRDYATTGEINLGGKRVKAMLVNDAADGNFCSTARMANAPVALLLDLKGTGRFSSMSGKFDVRKPLMVDGAAYEISGLAADGTVFKISPSSKVAATPASPASAPTGPIQVGAKLTPFEAKTIDGKTVHFPGDYPGKLTLLEFWATWCGPCRAEMPGMVDVYDQYHQKGFEILGVSLDNEMPAGGLQKFLQENHLTWAQISDGKGWVAELAQKYEIHSIPAWYLVDGATGIVVADTAQLRNGGLKAIVTDRLSHVDSSAPVARGPAPTSPEPKQEESGTPVNSMLLDKVAALVKQGSWISAQSFSNYLQKPTLKEITLLPPSTETLRPRNIAQRARQSYLRAGWYYHCSKCNRWHLNLAGSYAIAKDTVATAYHVLQSPEAMHPGEGYPIIVRGEDDVIPITGVLAADRELDAVVLRVGVANLSPLPLSADIEVGDSVNCLSDPHGIRGYFTTGVVNRIYSRSANETDFRRLRINVSTDWAPGSSGAAILDDCGNVIGHVARIQSFLNTRPSAEGPAGAADHQPMARATYMNLHEAIPAKSILELLKTAKTSP